MAADERTRLLTLMGELDKGSSVLVRIDDFRASYVTRLPPLQDRSQEHAIVIAEILVNYYTALETMFLRISQFFENQLAEQRWHRDLLHKMTLAIEGIREPALSERTASLLGELLKFWHFKRYYFEFSYDWARLDYLLNVLDRARPLVAQDLDRFRGFLRRLLTTLS